MFADFYRNKRVLVTGHTGFKGAWLCHWLLSLGANIAGISKDIPTDPALFDVLQLDDDMCDHRADIRQYDALLGVLQVFQPEVVFHLAAQPIVRAAFDDPMNTYASNVMGTVNVLEAVRHTDSVQQLIMITSDKCYHNVEWSHGYRENDRLGGKDPYSASKACAEIAIHSYWQSYYQDSDKQLVSARAGNVIGGGDWAPSRVVPDCMRAWSQQQGIALRAPHATRPWQHVLEPLSGYLHLGAQLASNPKLSGQAFNFGPNQTCNHSVLALVQAMQQHWPGAQYHDESAHGALNEAGLLKLSCDKALHHLSWHASCTFDETVALTVDWYHQYYQNHNMRQITTQQIKTYQQYAQAKGLAWANTTQQQVEVL